MKSIRCPLQAFTLTAMKPQVSSDGFYLMSALLAGWVKVFPLIPRTTISYLFKSVLTWFKWCCNTCRPTVTLSMRQRGAARCERVVSDLQPNTCNKLLIAKAGQPHFSSYQLHEVEKWEKNMAGYSSCAFIMRNFLPEVGCFKPQ